MAWQIWSPEDFPKRNDAGYLVDYCEKYRVQIILHQETWTELDPDGFYTQSYVTSWVDKEAGEKEITVSAKDVASRICRDKGMEFEGVFYPVGLMFCNSDRTTPEEIKALEAEGKRRNLIYRQKVVDAFEVQFRVKSQGGPGRWSPTTYERECYAVLGAEPPQVVNRPAAQVAPNIQIVQPDPALLAQLVAAEVAKIEAGRKPSKVI